MSGQPRVLMLSAEYPPTPGGVGDYTALLAAHLAASGAAVSVLTTGDGETRCAGGVTVHAAMPRWDWHCAPIVQRLVRETGAAIVHVQYQTGMYAMHPAINLLPTRLAWHRRVQYLVRRDTAERLSPACCRVSRVVTTFHDARAPYLFPKAGPLRSLVNYQLARASNAVVATNGADITTLKEWNPRAALVPIGSNIPAATKRDTAAIRARYGIAPDAALVTTFGLTHHSKGIETVIDALAMLRAQGMTVHLLLVGAGAGDSDPTNAETARRLTALCAARGVTPFMTRTGTLPAPDVAAVLAASDVCVQPYRDGASPRRGSLLAALAQGVPVVTTTPARGVYDGLPEPRDGEAALFVPPDDAAALAAAVRRIRGDAARAARLRAGARAYAAHFGWPVIARRHLDLYAALAAPRARPAPAPLTETEGEQ